MASIPLSAQAVKSVKAYLAKLFPECRSSHLSEALAYSLGFNTHATMLTEIANQSDDPMYFILSEGRLTERLNGLGYPVKQDCFFDTDEVEKLRETVCFWAPVRHSSRHKAWRNLMVATVNEALRRRYFSLRPGDNRWFGRAGSLNFYFVLPTGDHARVAISDFGLDEPYIEVLVNPRIEGVFSSHFVNLKECDAAAMTMLERNEGVWIQSMSNAFRCNSALKQRLLAMKIEPLGYGDNGGGSLETDKYRPLLSALPQLQYGLS